MGYIRTTRALTTPAITTRAITIRALPTRAITCSTYTCSKMLYLCVHPLYLQHTPVTVMLSWSAQ